GNLSVFNSGENLGAASNLRNYPLNKIGASPDPKVKRGSYRFLPISKKRSRADYTGLDVPSYKKKRKNKVKAKDKTTLKEISLAIHSEDIDTIQSAELLNLKDLLTSKGPLNEFTIAEKVATERFIREAGYRLSLAN
ncbi:hypothetical protein N7516_004740, partial [Penicillium verrucosum]|uniref:uncharacterized protein n=1 Tax=Penicillium verrucosum TaxID=60171 RepID=UPI0025458B19